MSGGVQWQSKIEPSGLVDGCLQQAISFNEVYNEIAIIWPRTAKVL